MEQTAHHNQPMSAQDFALLGIQQLAYVRRSHRNGADGYEIHAADGTEIAYIPKSRDIAFATVRQHDMEPVNVH